MIIDLILLSLQNHQHRFWCHNSASFQASLFLPNALENIQLWPMVFIIALLSAVRKKKTKLIYTVARVPSAPNHNHSIVLCLNVPSKESTSGEDHELREVRNNLINCLKTIRQCRPIWSLVNKNILLLQVCQTIYLVKSIPAIRNKFVRLIQYWEKYNQSTTLKYQSLLRRVHSDTN